MLSGQIKRGDGETIRSALVMGDMRKSTLLAEKEGRQVYIDTLNQFFDERAQHLIGLGFTLAAVAGDIHTISTGMASRRTDFA